MTLDTLTLHGATTINNMNVEASTICPQSLVQRRVNQAHALLNRTAVVEIQGVLLGARIMPQVNPPHRFPLIRDRATSLLRRWALRAKARQNYTYCTYSVPGRTYEI